MGPKTQQIQIKSPFKRTLVCVPTTGMIYHSTMNDLIDLVMHSRNIRTFYTIDSCAIQDARNNAVKRMLETDCDGILFIDSDQTFPNNVLDELIATHKDIVGIPIVRKTPPYYPNIGKWKEDTQEYVVYENYPQHNLFQVDYIGMGMTYIRREVFEKIEPPWFDFEWLINERYKKKGEKCIGEDVYFCIQAKKVGFKVWANPMIEVGHIGNFTFLPKVYRNYEKLMRQREESKDGEIKEKENSGSSDGKAGAPGPEAETLADAKS